MAFPWLPLLMIGGSLLGKGSSASQPVKQQTSDPVTIKNEPRQTAAQLAAQKMIMDFAETGKFGGYTAGEIYPGAIGDYTMTGAEASGQDILKSILSTTMPEMFNLGANEIKNMFTSDKYDPYGPTSEYAGLKRAIDKEYTESSDALSRESARTGNLYSTDFTKQSGKLSESRANKTSDVLASLYDKYVERKLGMIPTALNAGSMGENILLNRANASAQLGALERELKNQEAIAQYNEWMRKRNEKLAPLSMASGVMNQNIQYGPSSVTYPAQYQYTESPWSKLFDIGLNVGTNMLMGGNDVFKGVKNGSVSGPGYSGSIMTTDTGWFRTT